MISDERVQIAKDILVSAGQVFLASLIIPYFTGEYQAAYLLMGIFLTFGSWSMALFVSKKNI
ncbi:MAG: hypothetical protein AAB556_01750 [Patescibacteria group bacterium]